MTTTEETRLARLEAAKFLTDILRGIVRDGDEERVDVRPTEISAYSTSLLANVPRSSCGLVIGKGGRTVKALRDLLVAFSGARHHQFFLTLGDSFEASPFNSTATHRGESNGQSRGL